MLDLTSCTERRAAAPNPNTENLADRFEPIKEEWHLSTPIQLQRHAVRPHYYTSLTGDEMAVATVKQTLWDRAGFHPEVFNHAFFNNFRGAGILLRETECRRSWKFL